MEAKSALLVLLIIAFAGCLDGLPDLDEDSFSLDAQGVPGSAAVGSPFTFRLEMDSPVDLEMESQHIGAHYWMDAVADPTAAFGDAAGACQHVEGSADVPGAFDVTCTFDAVGTYHLHGHMRLEVDGETFDFWSEGHELDVTDFELSSQTTEASTAPGGEVTFDMSLSGDGAAESDHVGGHFWSDDVSDPTASFADQAGACTHLDGAQALPGTYTISCPFPEAGTYYLHGHVRLGSGDDLWTDTITVTVA